MGKRCYALPRASYFTRQIIKVDLSITLSIYIRFVLVSFESSYFQLFSGTKLVKNGKWTSIETIHTVEGAVGLRLMNLNLSEMIHPENTSTFMGPSLFRLRSVFDETGTDRKLTMISFNWYRSRQ